MFVDVFLTAVDLFFWLLNTLIFVRILMSWFPPLFRSGFGRAIINLTEPLLGPIRNLLAKSPLGGPGMPLDFSPIIAWVMIEVVKQIIYTIVGSFI